MNIPFKYYKRFVLGVLSGIFVISGAYFYYSAFVDLRGRIALEKGMIDGMGKNAVESSERAIRSGITGKEMKELSLKFDSAIPPEPSVLEILSTIAQNAVKIGIDDISFSTEDKKPLAVISDIRPKDVKLYRWPFSIRFKGTYYQTARLIRDVRALKREVDMVNLDIERQGQTMDVKITFAVYSLS